MVMYAAQKANNFYFGILSQPNFNPFNADFSGGQKYEQMEEFWLNFIVCTQIFCGVVLLVSIIQIRCIL